MAETAQQILDRRQRDKKQNALRPGTGIMTGGGRTVTQADLPEMRAGIASQHGTTNPSLFGEARGQMNTTQNAMFELRQGLNQAVNAPGGPSLEAPPQQQPQLTPQQRQRQQQNAKMFMARLEDYTGNKQEMVQQAINDGTMTLEDLDPFDQQLFKSGKMSQGETAEKLSFAQKKFEQDEKFRGISAINDENRRDEMAGPQLADYNFDDPIYSNISEAQRQLFKSIQEEGISDPTFAFEKLAALRKLLDAHTKTIAQTDKENRAEENKAAGEERRAKLAETVADQKVAKADQDKKDAEQKKRVLDSAKAEVDYSQKELDNLVKQADGFEDESEGEKARIRARIKELRESLPGLQQAHLKAIRGESEPDGTLETTTASGFAGPGGEQPTTQPAATQPTVTTEDEYNKLDVGDEYLDEQGNVWRKK